MEGLVRLSKSIGFKIFSLAAVMVTVVISLFGVWIIYSYRDAQEDFAERKLNQLEVELAAKAASLASLLAGVVSDRILSHDYAALEYLLTELRQDKELLLVEVRDGEGENLATYKAGAAENQIVAGERQVRVAGVVAGSVKVGLSRRKLERTIREIRERTTENIHKTILSMLTMLLLLFLTLMLGVFVVMNRVLVRPLRLLVEHMRPDAGGNFSTIAGPFADDEIGFVVATFNRMSGQISAFEQQLQRKLIEIGESEEKFRSICSAARDAIMMLGEDGTVLLWNEAAQRIFGYSAAEAAGKNLDQLLTPESMLLIGEGGGILNDQGWGPCAGRVCELQARDRGGREFPVEFFVAAIKLKEKWHAIAIIKDVSEEKAAAAEQQRLSAQFMQSQKMEAVGRLTGGVAHDFNNILTTIIGYSELVMRSLPDEEIKEQIRTVHSAGRKAAELVRQLLAFSRKQVMEMQVINLNVIVNGLGKMLPRLIGEDVEMKITTQTPLPNILADAGQVEQIVMNLVVNARDAMPMGGRLWIETSELQGGGLALGGEEAEAVSGYVVLTVRDNGKGMAPEIQEKIFEPFYTTKESGKGTGLGLSTVYGIVMQHHGQIKVESQEGEGTVFTLYFPVVQEEEAPPLLPLLTTMPGGKERILVVDDDSTVRQVLSDSLEPLGYRVLAAASGADAMRLSRQTEGEIDLLLTDVVMPGMNGRELAELLLIERPRLKVIYVSGYTDSVIVEHGVLQPGLVFINKPLVPSQLALKLREVFDLRPPEAGR